MQRGRVCLVTFPWHCCSPMRITLPISPPPPPTKRIRPVLLVDAQSANALVVGTTHRYRGKYITSVLYKPRAGRGVTAAPRSHAPRAGAAFAQVEG